MDREAIKEKGLDLAVLQDAVAKELLSIKGVASVIPLRAHYFMNDFEGEAVAMNLKAKMVNIAVYPKDIVPTLAKMIGAKSPLGSSGEILEEVMAN